jgi:ADP-ribosylglycohydrolase
MKKIYLLLLLIPYFAFSQKSVTVSKAVLKDKIKGGWAGQTIGVTFGGPVEFRYNGTIIQEYQPIPWYEGYVAHVMKTNDGLYDDLYLDLTWVDVIEKHGIKAPADSFANAYAKAGYKLWHANQAGRFNILHGIAPPQSGHWLNNPHADCIDYQIEADFSGLMSPAMPNASTEISDRVGHIMNYGDGWYGGVYIGALYSLAFTSENIPFIVSEALKVIPKESKYYKVIADVIRWHKQYPKDWKKTWMEIQDKWVEDVGCPDGVYNPFNIDATVNSAYVVVGLLYGEGDFTKTIEITTRCGQDADCNPSSSAGILGTIIGYDKIPEYWKKGLKDAEDLNFAYTTISLNKAYELSYKHALKNIELNGGQITDNSVIIKTQPPKAVQLEQSFENTYPIKKDYIGKIVTDVFDYDFEGTGIVVKGYNAEWEKKGELFTLKLEVFMDGKLIEKIDMPNDFDNRRHEIFWKYQLPKQKHHVTIKVMNYNPKSEMRISEILVYSDSKVPIENVYRFGQMPKKN